MADDPQRVAGDGAGNPRSPHGKGRSGRLEVGATTTMPDRYGPYVAPLGARMNRSHECRPAWKFAVLPLECAIVTSPFGPCDTLGVRSKNRVPPGAQAAQAIADQPSTFSALVFESLRR